MNKIKKSVKKAGLTLFVIMLFILIPAISAGFFDGFKKDVRLAPSQDTEVAISVGNAAPTIVSVGAIPATDPLSGTTKSITFQFTAQDSNGASDLNDASASTSFAKSGEPTRTGTCSFVSTTGNQKTYSCTVTMQYYDDNGVWTKTVSIQDAAAATGTDSSTSFTYNLLRDIIMTPTLISFPTTIQGSTNLLSTTQTSITNKGNFNTPTDGSVQVTAFNLKGAVTPAQIIPAANFNAGDTSATNVCTVAGGGTILSDGVATNIAGAGLTKGASGGGTIKYCLTLVPTGISDQNYVANVANANIWRVGI